MNQTYFHKNYYPWVITLMSALFLFYKHLMQVSPSIMTHDLMATFHLHGVGLGNLAATFFYSYMITQLFVGVLLDKLSPRYLSSGALFCAAAGTYFFSTAQTLTFASLSRSLVGVGAAFATVSYMKLAANWFPKHRFALVGGLLATAAMLGAIFGQAPLAYLVQVIGWRHSMAVVSFIGFTISVLFLLIVRDRSAATNRSNETNASVTLKAIKAVITKPYNWLLTLYSGLAFSPVAVIGGLWGTPFVNEAYRLPNTTSATLISFVFAGLAIGGPTLGYLSDRLKNRHSVMLYSSIASLLSITILLYIHPLPLSLLATLLFIFGFSTGAFMLAFAIGKETNPLFLSATIVALINTGDALFGAVTEPLIGELLDLFGDGKIINGAPYFSVTNYQHAFFVIPIYLAIATGCVFLMKQWRTADQDAQL